jgi:hypothetical protein
LHIAYVDIRLHQAKGLRLGERVERSKENYSAVGCPLTGDWSLVRDVGIEKALGMCAAIGSLKAQPQ